MTRSLRHLDLDFRGTRRASRWASWLLPALAIGFIADLGVSYHAAREGLGGAVGLASSSVPATARARHSTVRATPPPRKSHPPRNVQRLPPHGTTVQRARIRRAATMCADS